MLKYNQKEMHTVVEGVRTLATLKAALVKGLPAAFKGTKPEELPFPPRVVKDITAKDIKTLAKLFNIPKDEQYSTWARLYFLANNSYSEQEGRTLRDEMHKHSMLVPFLVFILLWGASKERQESTGHKMKQKLTLNLQKEIEQGRLGERFSP